MKKSSKVPGKGGPSSHKAPSASSLRKPAHRWDSPSQNPAPDNLNTNPSKSSPSNPKHNSKDNPSSSTAAPPPNPVLDVPPRPPPYSFDMLERRTIVLADGSVRSYFALPPDLPVDLAASDKFLPYGRGGPLPEHGVGYDRHYPPRPSLGWQFSPERFRETLPYGRGSSPPGNYWSASGADGPSSLKRKYGEKDEYARLRQQQESINPNLSPRRYPGDRPGYLGRPGSPSWTDHMDNGRLSKQPKLETNTDDDLSWRRGSGHSDAPPVALDVDPKVLKRAYLRFAKSVNENVSQRKKYLEDGKLGPLSCLACGRASKEFSDMHELIMHTYGYKKTDLRVDHLGLHKALSVLMGWDYSRAPDETKVYQSFSAQNALANSEDLIVWPPLVIIHNTNHGRRKDGRMEGMGNKEMDITLKDLGFAGGKSKSLYGKEGHLGVTLVKYANNAAGLKEADKLADFFENDNHGRRGWALVQDSPTGNDDDRNTSLVKIDEKTGEKKRILYGYVATASDLDKLDSDTRKKAVIKSKSELDRD